VNVGHSSDKSFPSSLHHVAFSIHMVSNLDYCDHHPPCTFLLQCLLPAILYCTIKQINFQATRNSKLVPCFTTFHSPQLQNKAKILHIGIQGPPKLALAYSAIFFPTYVSFIPITPNSFLMRKLGAYWF
jgi:hypothetical protein